MQCRDFLRLSQSSIQSFSAQQRKDAEALVEFCKFAPSKVNIIEYNPIDDGEFQQAQSQAIDMYVSILEANNITVTVRRSRGKDIDAACGQLANKS